MTIHGVMIPEIGIRVKSRGEILREKAGDALRRYRNFLLIVVLPTSLVAGYYYLIASDQYQSQAHFMVRMAGQPQAPGIGLSQALSAATGISGAQSEEMSIADYLSSHDAVDTLRENFDLVARFQRPGTDFMSRLRGDNPTPERLLKYYNQQVKVKFNSETGITTLTANAFTPDDAFALVNRLLTMGEKRVNILNARSYADSIASAQKQLAETEGLLAANQRQLTHYRTSRRDIDPERSGNAQMTLVTNLTGQLASAKAQLAAVGKMLDRGSPQYQAMAARVQALEAQVDAQASRLTGGPSAIAADIGGYEDLQMRQTFLTKRYEAAAASLDKARDQAQRQQLYVVRVVEPNHPVKSLYPERGKITLTVLLALMITYSVGWLIAAGMKEHAA